MADGMNARLICSAILAYALLILAVVVSRTTARPVASALSCAVPCVETAARTSGCLNPHDDACVCSIRGAILQGLKSCIDQACADEETVDVSKYLSDFCAGVFKTELATSTILSSSAPTTPPSADPSPTSASIVSSIQDSPKLAAFSTLPSSLPGWSASGSPTVFADRAAETTAGGKDDGDDGDKKESKSHKVGKIIGGVIGGIGGGLAAVMGIQSLFGGDTGTPCCCCCGCCGCGTMV